MKYPGCSIIILTLGLSCSSPRKNVALSELAGTYVATFENPRDSFELRKDGTYKHISGPNAVVSEGKWEAELEKGRTRVSFDRFLLNWPAEVPGSGGVDGWATYAEVLQDGTVELPIPGTPYYYKKQAPRR
jgi:hypothetical protein